MKSKILAEEHHNRRSLKATLVILEEAHKAGCRLLAEEVSTLPYGSHYPGLLEEVEEIRAHGKGPLSETYARSYLATGRGWRLSATPTCEDCTKSRRSTRTMWCASTQRRDWKTPTVALQNGTTCPEAEQAFNAATVAMRIASVHRSKSHCHGAVCALLANGLPAGLVPGAIVDECLVIVRPGLPTSSPCHARLHWPVTGRHPERLLMKRETRKQNDDEGQNRRLTSNLLNDR